MTQVKRLLAKCRLDHASVLRALSKLVEERSTDEAVLKVVSKPLQERLTAIEVEAAKIPSSLTKARTYLRLCVERNYEAIDAVTACRDEITVDHPTVQALLAELRQDAISTPQLGVEEVHSTSWALFLEKFGTSEAKARVMLTETEAALRRSIQDDTSDSREWFITRPYSDLVPPYDTFVAARRLWLLGRSSYLIRALRSECEELVETLACWQSSDGAWRYKDSRTSAVDDTVEATGLCLLALARFQETPRHQGAIQRAAHWLCQIQRIDGGWTSSEKAGERKSEVITSAIVRLALATSAYHEVEPHIQRADNFLLSEQGPLGFWEQSPWWPAFVTSIVLESLRTTFPGVPKTLDNQYLRTARELLPHGHKLLTSKNSRVWRLGIISLYHGLEALLYGCFVSFNPQLSIWQSKGTNQTIGLREALTAFRDRQSTSHPLEYEQQIRTLAVLRDSIIHRSEEVTEANARDSLLNVIAYLRKHSAALLPQGIALRVIWPDLPEE